MHPGMFPGVGRRQVSAQLVSEARTLISACLYFENNVLFFIIIISRIRHWDHYQLVELKQNLFVSPLAADESRLTV